MGRPADPISIAEAKGSIAKNRGRYASRAAAADAALPLGAAPAAFLAESSYGKEKLLAAWKELKGYFPDGTLTLADTAGFAVYVKDYLDSMRPGQATQKARGRFLQQQAKYVARAANPRQIVQPKGDKLEEFARKVKRKA